MEPLEGALAVLEASRPSSDPVDHVTARALVAGYARHWRGSGWRAQQVEEEFSLPVYRIGDGKPSETGWTVRGVIDLVVDRPGHTPGLFVCDHKTTSQDVSERSPYWQRLDLDSQISLYLLSMYQRNVVPAGCLWDVVRKPDIKPKALTKAMAKSVAAGDMYFGRQPSADEVEGCRRASEAGGKPTEGEEAAGAFKETPEMFEARLAADVESDPERYFARRIVYRTIGDVVEYAKDLEAISRDMELTRRERAFVKNPNSCFTYGSTCDYLPLCSGRDSASSDQWKLGEDRELKELSHSQMAVFQACKRKWGFRYVDRIKPAVERPSPALRFGSLFHAAMERYWELTKGKGE